MVDTSVAPYFDDFDEDKGFYRLLFRPTYAVQARELTQLQTVLQNQITRFGQNIFLEGSMVVPGGMSIFTGYEYVKLQDAGFGAAVAGATVVGNSSGVEAEIVQLVDAVDSDPATLYVRYTNGGGSGDGGRFTDGETLTWTNTAEAGGASGGYTAAASSATGQGTKVDLNKGIYFVRGFFAAAVSQSLIVEKYGTPTGVQEIGLFITESIVTSNDDSTLLDNASGSSNFAAPGAHRLKYALTLTKKSSILDSAGDFTEDYFTIGTLKDAEIVEQLDRSTYGILGDELARRTFDESGDYTVDPFILTAADHASDSSKLTLTFDPGTAYVKGYEINKPLPSTLDIDRARTFETSNNARIPTYFGNYVRVNNLVGCPDIPSAAGTGDLDNLDLELSNGTVIGTARCRAVTHESGSIYRLYLFDVQMSSNDFKDVHQLDGANFTADLIDDTDSAVNGNAKLYDTNSNRLLFPVPFNRVKSLADVTIRVQRKVTGTVTAGNLTLDTGSASDFWADTGSWICFNNAGAITAASYGTVGSQTIAVTGLSDGAYTFITYIDKTAVSPRTKTQTTVVDEVVTPNGSDEVILANVDIFALTTVKDVSDGDADITDRYTLDNGQRDNFYDRGKLVLKAGQTAPAGNVKVTYDYLLHGAGDYFNANSYNSLSTYISGNSGDVPRYTMANGVEIRLTDALDFRPDIDSDRADFDTAGSAVMDLPQHNETISADIDFYLPRIDVLYLDTSKTFGSVTGTPSLTPQVPQVPSNAMAIYQIRLNAGTIDSDDISSSFIENKRYTMRDIGRIEKRIDRIEEWATLSALEADTSTFEVLDANGNARFKSGFFADSFNDANFADFTNTEYRASIDPVVGECRPSFVERNTRMVYTATASDSSTSSGVTKVGDFLLLDYTEVVEIDQPLASSTVNVNPFTVITNTGGITLSPQSDEWRDVETEASRTTITETGRVNPDQGGNFNNWQWNWAGTPADPETRFDARTAQARAFVGFERIN